MNILFTICGRAGSKGFQNKNLKEMNGIPLVYYAISIIRMFIDSHPNESVTVALNTDSQELMQIVQRQTMIKDIQYVARKKQLADSLTAKVDVIKDTYLMLKNRNAFDVVVDLDITSPLRRLLDLENILKEYVSANGCDLVYSVVKARRSPYFNMVEKKADGFYSKICSSWFTARQQAPDAYEMNGSIYAYHPEFLESVIDRPITDYKCSIVQMPDFLVLDIDSEDDFIMMEILHRYYSKYDSGLAAVEQTVYKYCS